MERSRRVLWGAFFLAVGVFGCKGPPPTNSGVIAREPNRLLWGDTHVHTSNSADAQRLGNHSADPNTAYHWAKGLPVVHPLTGAKVQLQTPLDFLIVADHAEGLDQPAWNNTIEAAEKHYAPCAFTSFIGWEWTAEAGHNDLHRVVFMNDGAEQAHQFAPFASTEGSQPEDLWAWLGETSSRLGTDFIAIPHGSNLSGGAMFPEVDSEGQPITEAYAQTRSRWEPVAEVTQIRGDSEASASLFPNDEFAGFEPYPGIDAEQSKGLEGDYARSALLRGLQIDQQVGANPYNFGMIGSTDSHTGLASAGESYFWGAAPPSSAAPSERPTGTETLPDSDWSAQGLAGVWAEENTRESIFAAFKRKEVYATTGPRIRVRFFGGWSFEEKQASKANMVTVGYNLGRPMGSDLAKRAEGKAPSFLMYAVKDPEGANLDRIQVIKGWVDAGGKAHEKVYDVVWSGDRQRGPDGEVPPIDNTVDLTTGKVDDTKGAPALHGFWSDSQFDPKQHAFYYVRVLQVPTPRHSLYDAIARRIDPKETGHPSTIQERAYTSPIRYAP